MNRLLTLFCILMFGCLALNGSGLGQEEKTDRSREEEFQLGSKTAKGGFANEDEIRDKFNAWKEDSDAREWLAAMGYDLDSISEVAAEKPHGEKADVEVRIKTQNEEKIEGISIKLVSNPDGFNQIDKRWLKTYAEMWEMPEPVHHALKLFVGEIKPERAGRDPRRLFLDELDETSRQAILTFFTENREKIATDLIAGEGEHAAKWFMVTLKEKSGAKPEATDEAKEIIKPKKSLPTRWTIKSTAEAIRFFSEGEVEITSEGSLKIGRITMQRKGGDNGRKSANMLQFKVNPVDLVLAGTDQQEK